ncbi:MAG: aminoacyl-tRNA hydrolase [Bacteroidales bacterium]|nr:aminoacyl-tRNA hydrolase [Bacteroidales bacterium]
MEKYLICGLGNIGDKYAGTRHNIGFEVVDFMALQKEIPFVSARYGDIAEIKIRGRKVILLKPSTFMNLSGKAVRYYLEQEKIKIENLLVITDDVALPLGKIRIRSKGGDGGHNGLDHIIEILGTQNFNRLRFGVGNDYPRGMQVEYVLGQWFEEQIPVVKEKIKKAAEAVESFVQQGVERTMNIYNTL